ncbi:MAG: response regulator [Burkholderiales bacterium]
MLADDHGLFREGIALLLKSIDPGIEVSAARSAQECLNNAAGMDLVFLDLGLPGTPGLDALSALKSAFPELPVFILSGQEDKETVLESIRRGAMGFIPKSSEDPKLLWHAMKMAVSGAVTVPAFVTKRIPAPEGPATPESLGLTARQGEVLQLVLQGMPNKSIARRLNIAETTARGYVSDLLAAFRVANRTQLVVEMARRGLSVK